MCSVASLPTADAMGAALAVHTMIGVSAMVTARPYTNHDVNVTIPDLSWGTNFKAPLYTGVST